jgi:Cu/Ag efflux pump CusA
MRSAGAYVAAAAILAFLLLQAAFGSWRLAIASLVGLPVVALGSTAGIILDGRVISLGSILGYVAVAGLTLRIVVSMIGHFQALERESVPFGEELVRRGLRDCFPSTVATLITTGVIILPLIVLGESAGLEIAHPLAVAMLGGLVGSAVATLMLAPALYLRFGAGTTADTLALESAPNLEPALR